MFDLQAIYAAADRITLFILRHSTNVLTILYVLLWSAIIPFNSFMSLCITSFMLNSLLCCRDINPSQNGTYSRSIGLPIFIYKWLNIIMFFVCVRPLTFINSGKCSLWTFSYICRKRKQEFVRAFILLTFTHTSRVQLHFVWNNHNTIQANIAIVIAIIIRLLS